MKQVQDALKDIGIPVFAGIWKPSARQQNPPAQYLVYSTTSKEQTHFDDRVVATRTFVYLNLWSIGDPTQAAALVRNAMYASGFGMVEETDQGYNQPAYDTATRLYTVQWTWSLYEEVA
jgi:hypothetical protein